MWNSPGSGARMIFNGVLMNLWINNVDMKSVKRFVTGFGLSTFAASTNQP